jgi:hypothetical protein
MLNVLPQKEVKETVEVKASKASRRLSTRITGLFKSKAREEVNTPAKVDENPPKIDEPAPVAPLENPVETSEAPAAAPAEEVRAIYHLH